MKKSNQYVNSVSWLHHLFLPAADILLLISPCWQRLERSHRKALHDPVSQRTRLDVLAGSLRQKMVKVSWRGRVQGGQVAWRGAECQVAKSSEVQRLGEMRRNWNRGKYNRAWEVWGPYLITECSWPTIWTRTTETAISKYAFIWCFTSLLHDLAM